jgi:hypothetical protein
LDDDEEPISFNIPTGRDAESSSVEPHQSPANIPTNAPLRTGLVVPSLPTASSSIEPLSSHNGMVPVPVNETERSCLEVLDILTKFYGFLPPQGLSTREGLLTPLADIKVLLAITGTTLVKINSALWVIPMGKACIQFALKLENKEQRPPPTAIWDLAPNSPSPLKFSHCLWCIKWVRGGRSNLYMFDFGELSTVPWKIAVYMATAALMICCLVTSVTQTGFRFGSETFLLILFISIY